MFYVILSMTVFAAVCIGGSIGLLRYTPDSWRRLNVKIWVFELRASKSDDE
jgi:hypothetical protein